MFSTNKTFITFPLSGTETLDTGITRVDFIQGKATLPNGSIISLGNRSTQIKPLRSIFFNNDIDINVEINFRNKIIFSGLIPAGHFTIKDIYYDLIVITTSESTELSLIGSHFIDCIESEIIPYLIPSKTDGIVLLSHQAIVHNNSIVGSPLDVLNYSSMNILLFHSSIQAVTNTNPGIFVIQMSASGFGNEDWVSIYEFTATSSLAAREALLDTEPIGETDLRVSSISGFDDMDKVYIQDTGTLINSEWGLCKKVETNHIHLIDGLTYAKDSSDIIWNDADIQAHQLDLFTVTRVRVLFIHEGFAGADCHIKVMGITNN